VVAPMKTPGKVIPCMDRRFVGEEAACNVTQWAKLSLGLTWCNNNNNNNPICKAPECQKTSVALADRNSRAN